MKFTVLKSFTWAGAKLVPGDHLEIPDESPKIGSLTRAKFIRYGEYSPPKELPKVEEVAQEIATEEQPAKVVAARDPREIVRQAKAKATAKA